MREEKEYLAKIELNAIFKYDKNDKLVDVLYKSEVSLDGMLGNLLNLELISENDLSQCAHALTKTFSDEFNEMAESALKNINPKPNKILN